jgi:hypothetical protein
MRRLGRVIAAVLPAVTALLLFAFAGGASVKGW